MIIRKMYVSVLGIILIFPMNVMCDLFKPFSLAFLPSSNYHYEEACEHDGPICPYGDLEIAFKDFRGSISGWQTVKCGTIATINRTVLAPVYVLLRGSEQANKSVYSQFRANTLAGSSTFVVTTCSEHAANPQFQIASVDNSSSSKDILNYRLRNGIPFGADMSDVEPVFKKITGCS